MEIADLINRVESGRRKFAGLFFDTTTPMAGNGFDGEFELFRTDDAIVFEGAFVRPLHPVPVPFSVKCYFRSIVLHGASVDVSSPLLGKVSGRLLTWGEGFEFISMRHSDVNCSLHLSFATRRSFEVWGIVLHPEFEFAFHAGPASQWDGRTSAKIYALRPRKS